MLTTVPLSPVSPSVRRRGLTLLAAAVAISGLGSVAGGSVAAQTPAATPGPVACNASPRQVDDVLARWFGPDGTPVPTPTALPTAQGESSLPAGKAVDPAVASEVERTLREIDACFTGNQFARAFSLLTDTMVSQFGPDLSNPGEDTPAEVRTMLEGQLATPVAATPEASPGAITVQETRLLADGRVGVLFDDTVGTHFAIFAKQGGRWLLDGVIEVMPVAATPAG